MEEKFEIESDLYQKGLSYVAGVDEAGRGPLAGRVYAAAVILPSDISFSVRVDDSKKLTEKRREAAYEEIINKALCYAICYADEKEIDTYNILAATHLAMNRAVDALSKRPEYVLIDGNSISGMMLPHETVVKGDSRCLCIAAASILAKVSRDHYMLEMAKAYPEYGFEKHKGYGTKAHLEAIAKYGPCTIHRKTFRGVREYVKD